MNKRHNDYSQQAENPVFLRAVFSFFFTHFAVAFINNKKLTYALHNEASNIKISVSVDQPEQRGKQEGKNGSACEFKFHSSNVSLGVILILI